MHRLFPESLTSFRFQRKLRAFACFFVRFLSQLSLALFLGGFTFYAAVVVPDLHEHLGGIETGEISRRVAISLYAIGTTALFFGWLVLLIEIKHGFGWPVRIRFGLLLLNSSLLAILMVMHRSMGVQVDSGEQYGTFLSFHELYLTVWTGEWLGILISLALDVFSSAIRDRHADS